MSKYEPEVYQDGMISHPELVSGSHRVGMRGKSRGWRDSFPREGKEGVSSPEYFIVFITPGV